MPQIKEYNQRKLWTALLAWSVTGGLAIGIFGTLSGIHLFEVYGGMPGFFSIALLMAGFFKFLSVFDDWFLD